MAKIIVEFEYDPIMEHYPGCETVQEALELDVQSFKDGDMTLDELADLHEPTYRVEA